MPTTVHPSPADSLQALEDRLRAHWRGRPPRVDLGTMNGKAIMLPLEEIHVSLRVFEGRPEGEAFEIEELRALAQVERAGPDVETVKRHVDVARLQRLLKRAGESRALDEVMDTTPCLVLLGDPGSGKSSALRHYLSRVLASQQRMLPVFAPLANWDEHLIVHEARTDDLFQLLETTFKPQGLVGVGDLARERFEQGRLLLLLDGLDEVVRRETRTWLAERIRELVARAHDTGSRVIITSRYIGYSEAPVEDVPEFTIAPLTLAEITSFADRFYSRIADKLGEDAESAAQQREALLSDIRFRPEVRDLAVVPLHLVQLALLRRELGSLPDRRVVLYDRTLDRQLRDWQHQRSKGARLRHVPALDAHRTRAALVTLAFELHQRWASGTAPEVEVLRILGHALQDGHAPKPEEEARRLLDEVRRQAGVLVERGHRSYGFLHLSLEEFLAGQALAEKGALGAMQALGAKKLLHDARWQQPLQLAVAWLGRTEQDSMVACELIRRVREAGSEHEDLLHRDLLLAAELAAEPGALGAVRDELVEGGAIRDERTSLVDLLASPFQSLRWEAVRRLAMLARAGCALAEERLAVWMAKTRDISAAEAAIPCLHAPGCRKVRDAIRDRLKREDQWQVARMLVETLPHDEEDLAAVLTWARGPHERMSMAHMVWSALASKMGESRSARVAVLEELRRPEGELVLPPAPALQDDTELCQALLHRWAERGGHGHDELARALGRALADQGFAAEALVEVIRRNWTDSGHVVPALEAYAREACAREFLWSISQDEKGYPRQLALVALAPDADDTEIDRMLAGLRAAGPEGLAAWVSALVRVPPRDRVTQSLDEVLGGAHETARVEVVRARLSAARDETLVAWFHDRSRTVRDAVVPELKRRMGCVTIRDVLGESLKRGERDREAQGWAWGPLSLLYGRDERVRRRFEEAVEAGDEYASRGVALESDAPRSLRARALGNLDMLLFPTLGSGGDELIEIASESDRGGAILERLCKWPGVKQGVHRGALARALLPRLGLGALLERAGDALFHVLGDVYDSLSDEIQKIQNNLWLIPSLWLGKAPPVYVPAVVEVILAGVAKRDPYLFLWAPLIGWELHQFEGVTESLRAACEDGEPSVRSTAVRCLSLRETLSQEDVEVVFARVGDLELSVRREAVMALVRRSPLEGAGAVFRRHLDDEDAVLRHWSAAGLARAGELGPEEALDWIGVQSRFEAFWGEHRTDSEDLRYEIARSLSGRLGGDPELRKKVEVLLESPRWSERQGAAYALVLAEGVALPVDRLLEGLDDHRTHEVGFTQASCAEALLGVPSHVIQAEAIEILCRGLRCGVLPSEDGRDFEALRRHCAHILGSVDLLTRRPEVVKALEATLQDRSEAVRTSAWRALRRVLIAPPDSGHS